jgi:hypothetical protein
MSETVERADRTLGMWSEWTYKFIKQVAERILGDNRIFYIDDD